MGIEGVVGFLVTLLFEVRFFTRIGKSALNSSIPETLEDEEEDVDVAGERCRVEQLPLQSDDLIVVDNLTKVYRKNLVRFLTNYFFARWCSRMALGHYLPLVFDDGRPL